MIANRAFPLLCKTLAATAVLAASFGVQAGCSKPLPESFKTRVFDGKPATVSAIHNDAAVDMALAKLKDSKIWAVASARRDPKLYWLPSHEYRIAAALASPSLGCYAIGVGEPSAWGFDPDRLEAALSHEMIHVAEDSNRVLSKSVVSSGEEWQIGGFVESELRKLTKTVGAEFEKTFSTSDLLGRHYKDDPNYSGEVVAFTLNGWLHSSDDLKSKIREASPSLAETIEAAIAKLESLQL